MKDGVEFAASLLFGNTKSTFGIPQAQGLEQIVPILGRKVIGFSRHWNVEKH